VLVKGASLAGPQVLPHFKGIEQLLFLVGIGCLLTAAVMWAMSERRRPGGRSGQQWPPPVDAAPAATPAPPPAQPSPLDAPPSRLDATASLDATAPRPLPQPAHIETVEDVRAWGERMMAEIRAWGDQTPGKGG